MDEYYEGLWACGVRYSEMLREREAWDGDVKHRELRIFLHEFMIGVQERMPLMKLNRWLGYIQGVLIERKLTTVGAERDWTRPLFRQLDYGSQNE